MIASRVRVRWQMALTVIVLALSVAGCKPAAGPGAAASPLGTPEATSDHTGPLPTIVSVLPTPPLNSEDIEPTVAPSPTTPPVPTPLPTPVVTPIPVASPPFIPEVVGKTLQPFWIYYWQGNEVWRVDDQGKDRQLVIDTYKTLGQYLTDIPDPYKDSDCCWIGPRVVVSPDGQQLALVVVDKIQGGKGDRFTFSIYVFDVSTRNYRLISKGQFPKWSPDGRWLAFNPDSDPGFISDNEGELWVADLMSSQVGQIVKGDPSRPSLQIRYWAWSPDSQRLAYRFVDGAIDQTEIWIKAVSSSAEPHLLPTASDTPYFSSFSWMPDGEHLLCYSEHPRAVWEVKVLTGERRQLSRDFAGGGTEWSPDGKWLMLSAARLYERPDAPYDLWLLDAHGQQMLRLTSSPSQDIGGFWSPDGTRLVFQRKGVGLSTLSLLTGKVNALGVKTEDETSYSFAVGGMK